MRNAFFLLLAALLLAACGSEENKTVEAPKALNVFADSVLVEIADLQHARDGKGLLAYTAPKHSPRHRLHAIRGLASVQDSNTVSSLVPLLSESDTSIQNASAYALGQIGHASAASALLQLGQQSNDPRVVAHAWDALGRCGAAADLDSLLSQASAGAKSGAGMMAALYRFGTRGISRLGTDSLALAAIEAGDPQASFWACAFLGRVRDLGPVSDSLRLIQAYDRLGSPDQRQLLVRRLGRCKAPECLQKLDQIINDPKGDWRVRVNAIRAMAELKPMPTPGCVMKGAIDPNPHVALEAASYLRDHAYPEDAEQCHVLATAQQPVMIEATLYAAAVRLHRGQARAQTLRDDLLREIQQAKSPHAAGQYFLALAQDPANEQLLGDSLLPLRPIHSTYVMDALSLLYTQNPGNARARLVLLQKAVQSGDVALVAQTAVLLRDEKANIGPYVTDTTFLHDALQQLSYPRDVETWNEVRKTLDVLAGRPESKPRALPSAAPIDWELVKSIPTSAIWSLRTSKGDVKIRLHVEDAPATVANMVRLTRAKYFDGKYIHRVVSNFVAQGGCPRGDGWGSTEPIIRSEWPGLPFSTGAVGMASAGKDTESCQFFITHSSTPHLDGRYTVFGYVTEGMEVVDQLMVGDQILEAKVQ